VTIDVFPRGKSGECPEAPPIKDGEECAEGGECLQGRCGSFCERRKIGKKPCICSNPVDSCFRCCRSGNQTADCLPYNRSVDFVMPNGTRCIHGSCDRGVCIKEVTDVISHLSKIIDNLSRPTFWKFVGDNLVGIIVACSTLLWVPLAWLVSRMDTVNLEN